MFPRELWITLNTQIFANLFFPEYEIKKQIVEIDQSQRAKNVDHSTSLSLISGPISNPKEIVVSQEVKKSSFQYTWEYTSTLLMVRFGIVNRN